ncbi:MAG: NIPSNAP family protein [Candidatus Zixiibacteriota bacterium]
MIVVRDIFQIKFGKMRDVIAIWRDGQEILKRTGHQPHRVLTDLTGQYYTFVLESSFNSLAEFEAGHQGTGASEEWRKFYDRFTLLVDSGRREIFNVVA